MAIFSKARTDQNVVNGAANVCTGNLTEVYVNSDRDQIITDPSSMELFVELDSRYTVRPSGWSH